MKEEMTDRVAFTPSSRRIGRAFSKSSGGIVEGDHDDLRREFIEAPLPREQFAQGEECPPRLPQSPEVETKPFRGIV